MSRLKRFDEFRFIGNRASMRVYDCDSTDQLAELEHVVEKHDLRQANLLQTFAPDDLNEALNRSFVPVR